MIETNLDFEDKITQQQLAKYDFIHFYKKSLKNKNYSQEKLDEFQTAFSDELTTIEDNSEQTVLFLTGEVRKMFNGGLLTSLFGLNDVKELEHINFSELGRNAAIFEKWRKIMTPNKIGFTK